MLSYCISYFSVALREDHEQTQLVKGRVHLCL